MNIKSLILLPTIFIFLGCGSADNNQKQIITQPTKKEEISNSSIKPIEVEKTHIETKRYIRNLNETVTDTISHLTWQDNNDSNKTKLNWQEAISYCKTLTLGDFNDWRLPEVKELFYLSNKGESDNAFVNVALEIYHTNTTYSPIAQSSWYINFNYGFDYIGSKTSIHYVRCVRGEKLDTNFIKENNGTVTDTNTQLMWQDNTRIQDNQKDYEEAINYCDDLILENYNNWRVPDINELYSITDHNQSTPAINPTFTTKIASNFWSSTVSSSGHAWSMNFFQGSNYYHGDEYGWQNISTPLHIRCVREHTINDAPIASSQNITLSEDTTKEFQLQATDENNDTLTYHITTTPQHGSLSSQMPDIIYTPNANYHGSDSFSYIVNDGIVNSDEATIDITITSINDAPIANNITNQSTNEDSNFTLILSATDVDGDGLIYNIVNTPLYGDITLSNGNTISYRPYENYNGNDSFTFRANDGTIDSNLISVNITINPINDYPTFLLINERNITEDDNLINGTVTASDIDGDTLSFSAPMVDNFTINSDGNYSFNPILHQNLAYGEQHILTIPITISDGLLTAEQNLTINIEGINDPPIANAGEDITVMAGKIITFDGLKSSDVDNPIIMYRWQEDSNILAENNISFFKSDLRAGEHNITLTVTDESGAIDTDTMKVTVIETLFIPHTVTTNAIQSEWLEMVDLDQDGDLDILSASNGNGGAEITWYKNMGDNTFSKNIITANTNSSESIRAADMDNDGDLDILYTTYEDGASLMLCTNNGNETFTCAAIPNATNSLAFIEIVDLNHDNHLDIISASWENNRIDWYRNLGYGNFSTPNLIGDLNQAVSLHSADFNNDSYIDIVAASNDENKIVWYANNGYGFFTENPISGTIPGAYSVDVVDINNDDNVDIISTSNTNGNISIHYNEGGMTPSFGSKLTLPYNLPTIYYASAVDMDNDGDMDIVGASSQTNGRISWYENIGSNDNYPEHNITTNIHNIIRVFPADIDNDGNMDIISGDNAGNVIFYENNSIENEKKLPKTGQTISLFSGDDGDLQKGATRDYGAEGENIIENHTGLMWQDDSEATTILLRANATETYCNNKSGTYNDWRVPNIYELSYLTVRGNLAPTINEIFTNKLNSHYWTDALGLLNYTTYVDFNTATEHYDQSSDDAIKKNIRCVRGKPFTISLIKDDNAMVVRDYVHSLMWQDNAEAITTENKTLQEAITYCDNLTLFSANDWRVPNINELYSIMDPIEVYPAFNNIFANQDSDIYWSSTKEPTSNNIFTMEFDLGHDSGKPQDSNLSVRCVRDLP